MFVINIYLRIIAAIVVMHCMQNSMKYLHFTISDESAINKY